jgi:DNA-binding Lrp family transcriptional regulator
MLNTKEEKKSSKRILLLSIFDTWELFNKEIPQKIEREKVKEEIRDERARKLAPITTNKENIFQPTEISIVKALITNPQSSYIQISTELNLSRHTIKKRIEEMLKQNKIKFYLGVNPQKLNLDLMILTIHTINITSLNDLFQDLQNCPRVLLIVKDLSKSSLQVLFGLEKSSNTISNSCVNIIEKLQLDARVKECTIQALYPELFPLFIPFTNQNIPEKDLLSPCKANCSACEKYLEQKCMGCPASKAYRGNLFKKY